MSFWKILGGVTLAVGAAPFTGGASLLAVGGLGGAGAVAVGVGIAKGAGAIKESIKESGRREGEQKASSKFALKKEKMEAEKERLSAELISFKAKIKEEQEYFKSIIALFGIGIATANADGSISDDELDEINAFIGSVELPKDILNQIENLKNNPPNVKTAVNLIKELKEEQQNWELFEDIIKCVSEADNYTHEKERAFLEAFKIAKTA